MSTFRRFLGLGHRALASQGSLRFNRYYSGVIGTGVGYPTADEARKDLRNYDQSMSPHGWPR